MASIFGQAEQHAAAFQPKARERRQVEAEVDEQGRLVLPAAVAQRLGAGPGAKLVLEESESVVRLRPALTHLAKLYLEPTARCNLNCRTCVRHAWRESLGDMQWETFTRVVVGLEAFPLTPKVVFAGFGEPLAHPRIVDMVAAVKALGSPVELITNGTLLDEAMARQLVEAGLDWLWLSLDGARPESYEDVRLGAKFPRVLGNAERLRRLAGREGPALGITFVAMKRNIADLPDLLRLAETLGAARVMVSNVVPHTAEMCDEVLYSGRLADGRLLAAGQPWVSLPLFDASEATHGPLYQLLRQQPDLSIGEASLTDLDARCPFVTAGATAVGWDGGLSPCPPLMHDHTTYLRSQQRISRRHVVGNVNDRTLMQLWHDEAYLSFRRRVSRFDFPPCVSCGACHLAESNEDDCYQSGMPSCGGCPWAHGVIQCP